jgi:hypothetical protein
MESLELTTFEDRIRDRLFYDQYEFGYNIHLKGAAALRGPLTHDAVSSFIGRRNINAMAWRREPITDDWAAKLHDMCDILAGFKEPCRLTVHTDWLYVYTNNLGDLESIIAFDPHGNGVRARVELPRDVVLLENPQHQYRSYFRGRMLNQEQGQALRRFLLNRGDCYRLTPGLHDRLSTSRHVYVQDHFFIDHNDLRDIQMLSLVAPGIIRKTLPIQAK